MSVATNSNEPSKPKTDKQCKVKKVVPPLQSEPQVSQINEVRNISQGGYKPRNSGNAVRPTDTLHTPDASFKPSRRFAAGANQPPITNVGTGARVASMWRS